MRWGRFLPPLLPQEVSQIKYYGKISDPKDLATKEYVDNRTGGSLPAVTEADEGSILMVVGGIWTIVKTWIDPIYADGNLTVFSAFSAIQAGNTLEVR